MHSTTTERTVCLAKPSRQARRRVQARDRRPHNLDGQIQIQAIRCLKRYNAREVFRALRNPLEIKGPSWKDLRPARQALGITLVEAGKAPNVGFQRVSYAETGRLMNVRFLEEYDAWLKSQAKRES